MPAALPLAEMPEQAVQAAPQNPAKKNKPYTKRRQSMLSAL